MKAGFERGFLERRLSLPNTYPMLPVERILLIYPFAVQRSYDLKTVQLNGQFCQAPIGLGYIASYVKKNLPEVEIDVFDANLMAIKHIQDLDHVDMDELWFKLFEEVDRRKPDLIGVSSLFHEIAGIAHKTLAHARQAAPTAIGVMGGNYPEASPDIALSDDNVDFVILSEGEIAFTRLLAALRSGEEPIEVVDGIVCRQDAMARIQKNHASQNGARRFELHTTFLGKPTSAELCRVAKKSYPEELDVYPWPDRTTFDMDSYATYTRHSSRRTEGRDGTRLATMTASRGCPFKCTFCSSKNFWGAVIRHRDYREVVAEMKHLHDEHGINTFVFNDDNIMFDRRWVIELANEIIRQGLEIRWSSGGGIQASSMKPDVIQALHESGVRWFGLALESGNAKTLRRILKPLSGKDGQAAQIIADIRKYPDVWIGSNFVTGFHFETEDDILENHRYAGGLDLDWRSFFSFMAFPGSEDFENCVEAGYIDRDSIWQDDEVGKLITLSTENFSAERVSHLNYLANLEHNFLKNRNLSANPDQAIRDFNYVIEFVSDHAFAFLGRGMAERTLGRYDDAIRSFQHAIAIVDESQALRSSVFGGDKGVAQEVRWIDYTSHFNVDIEQFVLATQALKQSVTSTHREVGLEAPLVQQPTY